VYATTQKKDPAPSPVPSPLVEQAPPIRPKTLVFISHDSRDGDIAEAFANLLSDVSAGTLKSFRSSGRKGTTGIEFGAEWYGTIMGKLSDATDVVALLTQRSIDRPWILYEAGVAKGKLNATVFGIAIGVPLEKVSTGPFGQFENSADDEDSLTKLVLQLLQRNPDAAPREEAVRMQVRVFRVKLATLLKATAATAPSEQPEETSIAKLFEEVKVMVRDLSERIEHSAGSRTRRARRLHPMMIEDLFFHPALGENPDGQAAAWLMAVSTLRDDAPWLYEPGVDVYRALRTGDPNQIASASDSFQRVLKFMRRGPLPPELLGMDEEAYIMSRHLPEMLDHALKRISTPVRRKARVKDTEET
jgi:hypothetical protein